MKDLVTFLLRFVGTDRANSRLYPWRPSQRRTGFKRGWLIAFRLLPGSQARVGAGHLELDHHQGNRVRLVSASVQRNAEERAGEIGGE